MHLKKLTVDEDDVISYTDVDYKKTNLLALPLFKSPRGIDMLDDEDPAMPTVKRKVGCLCYQRLIHLEYGDSVRLCPGCFIDVLLDHHVVNDEVGSAHIHLPDAKLPGGEIYNDGSNSWLRITAEQDTYIYTHAEEPMIISIMEI